MSVRFETDAEPIPGYRLIDRLGSGGFGEVWRCEAPGGIFKAIKVIHGDLRDRATDAHRFAEQELKALKRVKQVRHPYLLALDRYDIVEGRLLITMELADCNLWDRFRVCRKQGLPGIPRDELLRYMSETAEVLDLFNDKFQLQHLDIKPQNLFLLYDHVKVADFGQVKDLEGIMAQVTGGITPVYAAPETFDGFVSRFCDQYSLACVYQELLTGQRPFDGGSMQQLLMQHLQMPPNLAPSPPCDRPALTIALAKKPDERFPNVSAMVRALRDGGALRAEPGRSSAAAHDSGLFGGVPAVPPPTGSVSERIEVHLTGNVPTYGGDSAASYTGPASFSSQATPGEVSTPSPRSLIETAPPSHRAPPLATGPGLLRPALVIGVGYTGLRVLQRFRRMVADRYGPSQRTPLVQTLYVDTDPEALRSATESDPGPGLAALRPDEVYEARIQRAGHYLKPRLNGRTLMEGWFDPQLLYKLPRTPATMGLRSFGRLAFCDHYRLLGHKIQSELEACLNPEALAETARTTGEGLRTNRPRVYVVAGLGGGTGGGMFLDLAYLARARLKRLGYDPEVVGVLLAPPDRNPADASPLAQANTYAALTELHHYGRPDTQFRASYDERVGSVMDSCAPFDQVVLGPGLAYPAAVPGSSATPFAVTHRAQTTPAAVGFPSARNSGATRNLSRRPGSGSVPTWEQERPAAPGSGVGLKPPAESDGPDPTAAAADYLRLQLFSPVGGLVDTVRPAPAGETPGVPVTTFGVTKLSWPRAAVVARAGRVLAPVLVSHWVAPDPTHVRQVIPGWVEQQWERFGLAPERLGERLTAAADEALGERVGDRIAGGIDQLGARGWLARLPEPERITAVLDQWQKLLGRPKSSVVRGPVPVPDALHHATDAAIAEVVPAFTALFPALIEEPHFRLAGTEEALRQVVGLLDRSRAHCERVAEEAADQSAAALDKLMAHVNHQRGMRKLAPTDFAEALRAFPEGRQRQLLHRCFAGVYRRLKDSLVALLTEVAALRQRVEACLPMLRTAAEVPAPPLASGEVLPPGCVAPEDAAQRLLQSLRDDDLTRLEARVQAGLEVRFGGLYQACLNSDESHAALLELLGDQARGYLDGCLGPVDFARMVCARYPGDESAARGLFEAFEQAAPTLLGNGPWAKGAINVFAGPAGEGGDPLRHLAAGVLPEDTIDAASPDELVLYREYPDIPLAAVPQLGPAWSNAYRAFPELQQATPHSRLDVTQWADVDG